MTRFVGFQQNKNIFNVGVELKVDFSDVDKFEFQLLLKKSNKMLQCVKQKVLIVDNIINRIYS